MSSTSSPPFAQVLHSITQTKFKELSKKRATFAPHLEAVRSIRSDSDVRPLQKIRKIIDKNTGTNPTDPDQRPGGDADTILQYTHLLQLAEHDPSISKKEVNSWITALSEGFERMASYWGGKSEPSLDIGDAGSNVKVDDKFEKVGRKEMHEQRAKFEEFVFAPNDTDVAKIEMDLDKLFRDTPEGRKSLDVLRENIKLETTNYTTVHQSDVEEAIELLLTADLLSNEKLATLKEFVGNKVVLKEFADVIKIYFSSVDTWSWPEDGVPIEMRRQLNGKYRVFMDEDLLQAVFLQCIGIFWSRILYNEFKTFLQSSAWKSATVELSKIDLERREIFLNETPAWQDPQAGSDFRCELTCTEDTSITKRRAVQNEEYFMSQLRDSTRIGSKDAYGDNDSQTGSNKEPSGPRLKQSLLHLMVTEASLNRAIRGQQTIVRSDFEWFGPSLSHTSMLAILKYFHVPQRWLQFFKTFLEAPLKFTHDGSTAETRVRKRGVPISHALSTALGESMLFCLDYAVNKNCAGTFLYRIYDDLWFWNADPIQCVRAWETMTAFANTVGLKLNAEKTGSICIGSSVDPLLPPGKIRWGFLELASTGTFEIDQTDVDAHIAEMRLQLAACKSVFAWVQAYNKYIRFFANNFATPARCFGLSHLKEMETALQRIHKALFPEHDGSVMGYLSDVIKERFGVNNIPGGWFFWPTRLGGLEVYNPFINLNAVRHGGDLPEDLSKYFRDLVETGDREHYLEKKVDWETGAFQHNMSHHILPNEGFMPFEEYIKGRECSDEWWAEKYDMMIEGRANIKRPASFPHKEEKQALKALSALTSIHGIDLYWEWIIAVWGQEMVDMWGGYCIVRDELLPLGMVEAFRGGKIQWEQ